jgi:hypothetical protein
MYRTSARGITITMSRALFALVTWLIVGSLMGITVWLALIEMGLA